jgi:hypothetical protein
VNKGWRQLSIRVVAIWRRWQGVLTALDQLKSVAPMPTVAGSPTQ